MPLMNTTIIRMQHVLLAMLAVMLKGMHSGDPPHAALSDDRIQQAIKDITKDVVNI